MLSNKFEPNSIFATKKIKKHNTEHKKYTKKVQTKKANISTNTKQITVILISGALTISTVAPKQFLNKTNTFCKLKIKKKKIKKSSKKKHANKALNCTCLLNIIIIIICIN